MTYCPSLTHWQTSITWPWSLCVWLRCWLFLFYTVLKNQEDAYCMETNSLQDVSTAGTEPVILFKSDKIKNHPLSAYSFDMDCSCICLIVCYKRLEFIKVQDLENIFLASPLAACIVKCILSDFRCTKTWPTDMSLLRRHSQRWDKMFTISERYIVTS